MKKPSDPLTVEEVKTAAETFFPLFQEVKSRMPLGASTEDTLKIMESVCALAHKQRATKDDDKVGPFGFNKPVDEVEEEKTVDMYFGSEYENGINYDD